MARLLATIEGCDIWEEADGRVHFVADADVDADGANAATRHPLTGKPLFAYGPDNSGLDDIRNISPDDLIHGRNGEPLLVVSHDYKGRTVKGFYSKTAWYDRAKDPKDPARYLDSCAVPYIVVPPVIRQRVKGILLGCKARATYRNQVVNALVGDIGPSRKVGELSIAAADALGIPSNPRTGGVEAREVLYECWPGCVAIVDGRRYSLIPA